jgi:serine protease Do
MKNYFLKMAAPAALLLAMHLTASAQVVTSPGEVVDDADTITPLAHGEVEVIIRHKTDKDAKVTVEIKNGEVYVNGKPASEYEDDNIAITKRKVKTFRNGTILMDGGDMSPFRSKGGVWNFNGNIDGQNFGAERAFLGVSSFRPDDGPAGAKISQITDESAAKKAGLELGDIITKVDDIPIDGPEDLSRAIGKYKPGEKVTITFKRDGKEQKVTATLGKTRSMSYSYGPNSDNFDFKQFTIPPNVYNFSYGNSARLGIRAQDTEDGKGVKVLDVDEESAAAKAGIKEGDVITQFDGKEVNSAPALANAARESRIKTSVHVSLLRGGKALELDIKTPRKLRTADL